MDPSRSEVVIDIYQVVQLTLYRLTPQDEEYRVYTENGGDEYVGYK
jgi:hypothetical protein